jgi:hypothetical protein
MVVRISRPVYLNGVFPRAVHCQYHRVRHNNQPFVKISCSHQNNKDSSNNYTTTVLSPSAYLKI